MTIAQATDAPLLEAGGVTATRAWVVPVRMTIARNTYCHSRTCCLADGFCLAIRVVLVRQRLQPGGLALDPSEFRSQPDTQTLARRCRRPAPHPGHAATSPTPCSRGF